MSRIFLAGCLLLLAGCSYHTHYVSPSRVVYPPLGEGEVSISPQKKIATPHKVIGRVAVVDWGNDGSDALNRLRREAARIGGNVIIDLRVEKTPNGVAASGLAVLLHAE